MGFFVLCIWPVPLVFVFHDRDLYTWIFLIQMTMVHWLCEVRGVMCNGEMKAKTVWIYKNRKPRLKRRICASFRMYRA